MIQPCPMAYREGKPLNGRVPVALAFSATFGTILSLAWGKASLYLFRDYIRYV